MKQLIFLLTLVLLVPISAPVASAKELAIWDKLKGTNPKGYILLMRHALAPGAGDQANFRVGDCSTQRNLSQEGRVDAKEIGDWIKRREIKTHVVESSRRCRA